MIDSFIISQSNLIDGYLSLSVHNTLVFLCDAIYDGQTPDYINCEVKLEGVSFGVYRCVALEDVLPVRRTFMLKVDNILKAYMGSFDETQTSIGTLEHISNMSSNVELIFSDPNDEGATPESIEFIAVHAAREYGENPCLKSIEDNEADIYYAFGDYPVSVYFFNNSTSKDLALSGNVYENMLSYDDEDLLSFDDEILISI